MKQSPTDIQSDCSGDPSLCTQQTFPPRLVDEINNNNGNNNGLNDNNQVMNPCQIDSALPGCSDPYCQNRICQDLNQTKCCTDGWDMDCVTLASAVCIPEVIPMYEIIIYLKNLIIQKIGDLTSMPLFVFACVLVVYF